MLTRHHGLRLLAGMTFILIAALVTPGTATAGPIAAYVESACDDTIGICLGKAESPGASSSSGGSSSKGKTGTSSGKPSSGKSQGKPASKPTTCEDKWGKTVPCSTKDGAWSSSDNCYWALQRPQDAPPAGKSAADGAWYVCTTRDGSGGMLAGVQLTGAPVWRDSGQAPPEVIQISPAQAAAQVIKTMKFTPVQMKFSTDALGGEPRWDVGMPLWLWVGNSTDRTVMGPQTVSGSAGGVTITLNATISHIEYSMGDGKAKTCSGPGTPYEKRFWNKPSRTCGYVYSKMSPREGKEPYTLTATAHWDVAWSGEGESGVLPMETTSTRTLRVGEIQTLNVENK